MPRIEKSVFISYRRTNIPWALSVYLALTQHGYDVFFDYEGVGPGNFESIIVDNITSRAHFIIILTPSALERCHEPGDWLRREIEIAIESKRNIVPLMLEGFSFGTPSIASQLTGTLASLKFYNGLTMPAEYLLAAMEKLRTKFLSIPFTAVLQASNPISQQAAAAQKSAANVAPPVQEKELTAQQYFERGLASFDPEEAIRLYSEAIRLEPTSAAAYNARGLSHKIKGDLLSALSDLDETVRLTPKDAGAHNNRGNVRLRMGTLDEAIADYDEAISFEPDFAEAYSNRGNARSAKGDIEGAIVDYGRAIALAPYSPHLHHNRAFARSRKGDLDGALSDYDEVIRLWPSHNGYNRRGIVRTLRGDLEEALEDYNEAIRLRPDFADAYFNRANLRKIKGDLDGALVDYDQALKLERDYVIYNNRGVSREAAGDLVGAEADYDEAIRLKPNFAGAYNNRAILRTAKGDLDGALADYDIAVRLNPGSTRQLYDRALIYRDMARYIDAIADLRQWLSMVGNKATNDKDRVEKLVRELQEASFNPPRNS